MKPILNKVDFTPSANDVAIRAYALYLKNGS